MPKSEISWKRVTDDGVKLQVSAQHVGREWVSSNAKSVLINGNPCRNRRWKIGWNCWMQ